jgi:integrase
VSPPRAPRQRHIPRDKRGTAFERAVGRFVSRADLSEQSRSSYRKTLRVLEAELGGREPRAPNLEAAIERRWDGASPATWNRTVATVRSFLRYAARTRLLPETTISLERRREPADRTRAIPRAELEALFARKAIPLRERALWRMLYETAARASEVLALDIGDLDLANKRARIQGKGDQVDFVHWQSGTARLLPRLVGERTTGPVFLANRRLPPARAAAAVDVDHQTGRARLSYRRAEELFRAHTGSTLHQLRHSAITHLAEENVELPLLMAKSRHLSLRSLQRYARPGVDAVAAMTAAHDPARRRK